MEEELEMILDKVNLYVDSLDEPLAVHDTAGSYLSSPTQNDEVNVLHVSLHVDGSVAEDTDVSPEVTSVQCSIQMIRLLFAIRMNAHKGFHQGARRCGG